MSDALYAQCQKTAGKHAFSPWAENVLAQAAGQVVIPPGTIPGGLCAGSTIAGPCGRSDAWIYLKSRRVFLCAECCDFLAKSSPSIKDVCEDRRPKLAKEDHREQLIQAAKNAMSALIEFDRTSPPARADNSIPADILSAVSTSRTESPHE